MKRLVLLLFVGLGWLAYTEMSKPKRRGRYIFPTSDSHGVISLEADAVEAWCETLGCGERALKSAVAKVGSSEGAVRSYLASHAAENAV